MNFPVAKTFSKTTTLHRMMLERSVSERISVLRQLREILYLWLRNGIGPFSYHRMGLYRRSLTWAQKKEFASKRWYLKKIDRINVREHRIVAWHKVVANGVLQSFNVPSPPFYGFASPVNGQCADGHPLRTPRDLVALIERAGLREVCFKLAGGWSGRGFMRVSFELPQEPGEGGIAVRIEPEGTLVPLDVFWRDYVEAPTSQASPRQGEYGYMCQGVVEQHPAVAGLHRNSVNTLRVWMAQRSPGHWEMVGAVLRIGTGSSIVDNGVAGGIGAPVNLKTGRLGRAVRRGRGLRPFQEFDRHPTTDAQISGFAVPTWDSVAPLCRCACAAFPYFRFMGVDVAIAPDGPVVVEVEADPHQSHQAHLALGLRPIIQELVRARQWFPPR